jgi:hypothetical protein
MSQKSAECPDLDHGRIASNLLILLLHGATNGRTGTRTIWRKCADHTEVENRKLLILLVLDENIKQAARGFFETRPETRGR